MASADHRHHGMCVAGGAYLPVMVRTHLMTEASGLFWRDPALVAKRGAIGQKTLRGRRPRRRKDARANQRGTVGFPRVREPTPASRLRIRALVTKSERQTFRRSAVLEIARSPLSAAMTLRTLSKRIRGKQYDMRENQRRV